MNNLQWILDLGIKLDEKQLSNLNKQIDALTKAKKEVVIGISTGDAKMTVEAIKEQEKVTAAIKNNLNLTNKEMTKFNSGMNKSASLTKKVVDGYSSIERKLVSLQQKNQKAFSTGQFAGQLGDLQGLMGDYKGASGNLIKQDEILGKIKNSYTELNSAVTTYNQTEKTFGQQVLYNSKRFIQYTMAARGFFAVISTAQKMVQNVRDLDKSLVDVQKVTNLAGRELEIFTQRAFEAGNEVARTGKEIIDATAVFARSGYTIKESLDLATESAILLNVADNMTSIEESAQTLISTLKAYNLEADDARKVTDIFNEVSNNSAISFDDLTEAVRRSGSIFAQSNTSIEEFSALITGTNEIIQNVEKSSTGRMEV